MAEYDLNAAFAYPPPGVAPQAPPANLPPKVLAKALASRAAPPAVTNAPATAQPVPAAAAGWVNPNQAALDAATAAYNAPQAPAFTPEQIAQRQAANQRAQRWGILGLMMGDEGQQKAGGAVLQQAMAASAPRVTDRGIFDPTTGQMTVNPEFASERAQSRMERLQDLTARSQESHDTLSAQQEFQRQQLQAQLAERLQAAGLQRESLGLQRSQIQDQKNLQLSRQFNEDWQKTNKDDLQIKTAFQNLASLPSTPAGDISFVYNWMKAQDPGSTVRESEFAAAARAGNLGAKIQNMVNQVTSGNLLTPQQRAEMMGSSKAIVDQADSRIAKRNQYYDQQATNMGVDPSWVVPEYGRTPAEIAARANATAAGPVPGADRRAGADRRGAGKAAGLPQGVTPDMIAAEIARRGGK